MSDCGCIWGGHPEANAKCRYTALLEAAKQILEQRHRIPEGPYGVNSRTLDALQYEVERAKEKA